MKIVQINSVCGVGSTGRIAVELYKKYNEEGHKCFIAYGRGNAPKELNTIKIGNKFDFYFHALFSRFTDRQGFYSRRATKKFITKLLLLEPDLVHLHNIHGYYLHLPTLFSYLKENNIEVVWTMHDCWAFTGHCSYFEYSNCQKWKMSCGNCPQKKEYPKSLFLDQSRRNLREKREMFADLRLTSIITPSSWLKELVEESLFSNYNVKVINNTINTDIFKYRESDFRQKHKIGDRFVILCVASPWNRRKGYQDILKLASVLDKSRIIVVVGVNDQQLKELPSNVLGIKRTENAIELAEIYSAADLFFNPTYEDNYPTVNLEAEACGLDVYTYDSGGSRETIKRLTSKTIPVGDYQLLGGKHEKS